MTLKEMINTPEAKKLYRTLLKKHHPDLTGSADDRKIKKLTIDAKEMSSDIFVKKYGKSTDKFKEQGSPIDNNFWKNIKKWVSKLNNDTTQIFLMPRMAADGKIYVDVNIKGGDKLLPVRINPSKIKNSNDFIEIILKTVDRYA